MGHQTAHSLLTQQEGGDIHTIVVEVGTIMIPITNLHRHSTSNRHGQLIRNPSNNNSLQLVHHLVLLVRLRVYLPTLVTHMRHMEDTKPIALCIMLL